MWYQALPHLNAVLNLTSAALATFGYLSIRGGADWRHRRAMLAAFACSVLFLASYLVYHSLAGHTRYAGSGFARTAYLAVLLSHTVLAAVAAPMVVWSLYLALRGRRERHRRVARCALPIWLYVSATGVAIYAILYLA